MAKAPCILVIKKPEIKFPAVCLLDVPVKESENVMLDKIKFVIRARPKALGDSNELASKGIHLRIVEERKEEYDRARARIFSSSSNSESEDASIPATSDGRNLNDVSRNLGADVDKVLCSREIANSSRVAIFRDREKDLTDLDYDRSYDRYVKSIPSGHRLNLPPLNMQSVQISFVQYDSIFPRAGQMHAPQPSINYQSINEPLPCNGIKPGFHAYFLYAMANPIDDVCSIIWLVKAQHFSGSVVSTTSKL